MPNLKGPSMKLNKVDEAVVAALKPMGKELTLSELAAATGQPEKKVFKSLKKLFESEMIDSSARKYKLLADKPPKKEDDTEVTE
jgi:DNA-binding Lrp family transcriptional regulator